MILLKKRFSKRGHLSDLKDAFEGEVKESPVYEKIEDGDNLDGAVGVAAIFPFEQNIALRLEGILSQLGIKKLSIIQGKSFVDRDWVALTQEQFRLLKSTRSLLGPQLEITQIKHSEAVVVLTIDPGAALALVLMRLRDFV